MNRPDIEISNVEKLANDYPDERVCFVSNIENDDFNNYIPTKLNIEKYISGLNFSISSALNTAINNIKDEQYVCRLGSNVSLNGDWVERCINVCEDKTLKTGVIGIRKHTTFPEYNKHIGNKYGLELY